MNRTSKLLLAASLALLCLVPGCGKAEPPETPREAVWRAGFGCAAIPVPETQEPLYIAGYHNGWEITGIRDLQEVRALWLDAGGDGVLILSVDCVGLGSDTVDAIRDEIKPLLGNEAAAVHVAATHTHAGLDTLGLWGPVGMDGKNPLFMENLHASCVSAAREALADRKTGRLYRSDAATEELQRDSRDPQIYDTALHLLRFAPDDGGPGIRLVSYGALAESLRGANTRVSRDYPGVLCDLIAERTGDRALFFAGAVGGLIMTKEFVSPFDAEENLLVTGEKLAAAALSGAPERELEPGLSDHTVSFTVPLDNTVFLYYKFLGILGNEAMSGSGATEYVLRSRLSLVRLGDASLLLLPGEIFPELITGGGRENPSNPGASDPEPLQSILSRAGITDFIPIGLADDELGYIVPPSDYLVDETAPYLNAAEPEDGSRHYEETNSVGIGCAGALAGALEDLLKSARLSQE